MDQGTKPILIANWISPVDSNAKNVYVFNGNPSSIFGGIATYVAKVLRVKSVSVVYPQDAQSVAGAQALGSALKSVGVTAKSVRLTHLRRTSPRLFPAGPAARA